MNDIKLYEKIPVNTFPVTLQELNLSPAVFPLHWHEHIEINFILDGKINLRCDDKQITAESGDCVIFNSNELHQGLGGEKCKFACIILSPSFFDANYVIFKNKIRDGFIAEEIQHIFNAVQNNTTAASSVIKGHTYLLIAHLIDNYVQKKFRKNKYTQHQMNINRINDAIKYIEQNYTDTISTKRLAKLTNVSEGHFCHIFKETTGKTAKEYQTNLKLNKAVDLLKTTDMTVLEIAMQCGFSDANYFARIFKKYRNCTPNALRQHKA